MSPPPGHLYLAHAFGARYQLPIPLLAFVLGGAAVVAISFAVVLPSGVRASTRPAEPDRTDIRSVPVTAGLPGVAILAVLCWTGIAGSQQTSETSYRRCSGSTSG